MNIIYELIRLPRVPVLWSIRIYQKILSPDHSFWARHLSPHGYCKYQPSCSEYGYQVIKKRGLFVGLPKTIWRIMRCNPWSRGGEDLPK